MDVFGELRLQSRRKPEARWPADLGGDKQRDWRALSPVAAALRRRDAQARENVTTIGRSDVPGAQHEKTCRRQSDMDVVLMIPAGDTMSPAAARHEADHLG